MYYLKQTSLAVCGLMASSIAASQVDTSPSDLIVVTAKGQQTINNALHTATVLTLEDIEAAQVKDLPALLSRIAGVGMSEAGGRGSVSSVFIRGVSNSQIIVLIDGVRVGSATLGSAALNGYPIEAIERIEVLKGPFSGLYGADAVGGVVQLFTKKGGDDRGTISASVGSDALSEYQFALNGSGEKYSFQIAGSSESTDGIDRTSITTGGNDDRDGFEQDALSLGAQYNFSDISKLKLSILATDSMVEFDNTFGVDAGLVSDTSTLSTALAFNTQLSDAIQWSTTLGLNQDESVTNGDFPSEFTTNRDSLGTEFNARLSTQALVTFGVDYYQEDIESNNTYPITDRDNLGAFAQVQFLGDTFGTVASFRYDDNSAYGSNTNGSIALSANLTDNLKLIGSYGTAFVAPSFNFLYFPFFGNPDILPEESESFELSLDGQYSQVTWRLSAYRTDIENLFSFDPNTFLAANIGKAKIDGIEADINTSLADWAISIQADVLSATNAETGIELDDRAQRSLTLSAAKDFGRVDLQFDLRSESQRFDNTGVELSGYALFDVSAIYQVTESITVAANIDNVFDKDYTLNLIGLDQRYNTEGRQAKLTLKYRF